MDSKKKNYYYVLVFANDGPAYVTSVDYRERSARWEKDKAPKAFTRTDAENLVFGLRCNWHNAVVVHLPIEIDYQPYNYKAFECKFEKREDNNND